MRHQARRTTPGARCAAPAHRSRSAPRMPTVHPTIARGNGAETVSWRVLLRQVVAASDGPDDVRHDVGIHARSEALFLDAQFIGEDVVAEHVRDPAREVAAPNVAGQRAWRRV